MNEKYRHEYKYLITQNQVDVLKARLSCVMKPDPHTQGKGQYTISSLYFDDYDNRCFYENLAGVSPREKYRIRIYNHDISRISLECKRKDHGMTQKNSCLISAEECLRLMNGRTVFQADQSPVLTKFQNEIRIRAMHPVVIVEYERIPFVYKIGNVRVTLDMNLSSSSNFSSFLGEPISRRPVLPAGMHLLEVKYDQLLPDYLCDILSLDNLNYTAFSKYFLCRKFDMEGAPLCRMFSKNLL